MSPTPCARKTVACTRSLTATGVHSGRPVTVAVKAAACGEGLLLERTDVGKCWPLTISAVTSAPNCTAIGDTEHSVMFVEHLMAALWAAGISDVRVEVDGPEIPLCDGSARPFVELLGQAGCHHFSEPVEPLVIAEPMRVGSENQFLAALPGQGTEYAYLLDHPHPLVGLQFATFRPGTDDFAGCLAAARTWGLADELRQAQAAGLFTGGSEQNSLIIFDDHYSQPPTLPHEFARHKLVDLIGDLYLVGRPLVGTIVACRTGHAHNHELARRLAGSG